MSKSSFVFKRLGNIGDVQAALKKAVAFVLPACAVGAVILVSATDASAASIGINYANQSAAAPYVLIGPTPPGPPVANSGQNAGVVDQYYWNNTPTAGGQAQDKDAAAGAIGVSSALDSNGNATTLGVTWTNNVNNFFHSPNPVTPGTAISGDQSLFSDYWRASTGTLALSITGVPTDFVASKYDLYIYYGLHVAVRTGNIGVSGTVFGSVSQPVINSTAFVGYQGTTITNGWQQGNSVANAATGIGNYLLYSGMSDTSFNITATGGSNIGIYGFQLVQQSSAVPEPASLGFTAMAGLALLRRRSQQA